MKYPFLTKEFLHEQYVVLGKSSIDIQKEFGVQAYGTIEHYIRKYCLTRPRKTIKPYRTDITKELLIEELYVNKLTTFAMAAKYKTCRGVIRKRMKLFGLSLNYKRTLLTEDVLRQLYIVESKSCMQIAILYDTYRNFIGKLLKKFNISSRKDKLVRWKNITDDVELIGYKDIHGAYWRSLKASANDRDIPMQISIIYAWDMWEKQQGLCAITGQQLTLSGYKNSKQTASIDRIDSTLGYIEGNIQWVHKKINRFKHSLSMSEFFDLVKQIAIYNNLCS